jgi:hypothetical protein
MPPPHGERSTMGQLSRERVRVRSRAAWVRELVDRWIMESGKLNFGNRPETLRCEPYGETGDRGFGTRRVDHTLGPELFEQAVRRTKYTTVDADVLAEHEDPRIF